MTLKPVFATALLLAALLSGCAEEDDPETQTLPAPDDPVSQALGAAAVVAAPPPEANVTLSLDTPFLMPATSGPDAPITAFRYRLPEGAVTKYMPIPDVPDFVIESIIFEMVPVITNGTVLESFAILVFDLSEEEAQLRSTYLGVPQQGTFTFAFVQTSDLAYTPTLESTYFYVSGSDLEAGDEIGFVLVGKSAAAGSFGLLMSPLPERPEREDEPAETPGELLDGRSAATLTPSGTGAGFGFGLYLNENLVFLTSVYHIEVTSGDVQVEDRTRTPTEPAATVRQATVSTSYDGPGYTEAIAELFTTQLIVPSCLAVGTYDIQMDLHGTLVDHRNLIVEVPAGPSTYLVTGWPIAFGIGEGQGGSSVSLDFQVAHTCSLELIIIEQLDLGATMQELFGIAGATGAAAFSGIAGNLPPMQAWREGDDLVRYDGQRLQRLDGLGFVLDMPVA